MSKSKFSNVNTAPSIDFRNDAEMVALGLRVSLKQPYVREKFTVGERKELKQAIASYKAAVRTRNPKLKQLSNETLATIVNSKYVKMNLTLKPMNYN